ncbi:hypothetical protein pb186bvf_019008 [Paramecium bursaria]
MSLIYDVVDQRRNIFRDFIRVKCLGEDCQNQDTKLISVPIEIKYLNGHKRIIAFFCDQHQHNIENSSHKYEISPAKHEIQKQLKPRPQIGDQQILLHNAQMKLDSKSCCFRENKKYQNLDTLLNSFSILSNDVEIIKNQILRIMTQKYFQLFEVKKKINEELEKEASKLNPLYVISLIENRNQIVKVLAKIEYISIIKTQEILFDMKQMQ